MGFAILPTTLVAIFLGFFLGFTGLFPMILSYTTASLLGYYASQRFERGQVLSMLQGSERLRQFVHRFEHNQYEFAFWLRLTPLLTFALTNILVSALRMRLKAFLIGGTLGMLPRVIFVIWVASQAKDLSLVWQGKTALSDWNIYSFWILATISVLGLARLLFFHRKV
jgi:uncharacterized membrane protein YdjX (TVP38/TMEM64 family)